MTRIRPIFITQCKEEKSIKNICEQEIILEKTIIEKYVEVKLHEQQDQEQRSLQKYIYLKSKG